MLHFWWGLSFFFIPMIHTSCALEYPPCTNPSVLLSSPPQCFSDMANIGGMILHHDDSLCPDDICSMANCLGWRHSITLIHCVLGCWDPKPLSVVLLLPDHCYTAFPLCFFEGHDIHLYRILLLPSSSSDLPCNCLCLHLNYLTLCPQLDFIDLNK